MQRTWRVSAFTLWCAGAAAAGAAPQAQAPAASAASPVSALPLKLTGVVVDTTAHERSVCLIRCPDAVTAGASLYGVGDRACGLAEVHDIRDDMVVVRNLATNRLERLDLAPGGPTTPPLAPSTPLAPAETASRPVVAAPAPDLITVAVSRDTLERYWADLPSLLTSVQATPHYEVSSSGQRTLDGFAIGATPPGGVIDQLGLRSGDILLDVNGDRLDTPAAAMRLLAGARDMTQARLRIRRDGQPMTVLITVR